MWKRWTKYYFYIYSLRANELIVILNYLVSASCPSNWIQKNGSCYLKGSLASNFYTAQADCEAKGGNLVIINSDDEFNFIFDLCLNNSISNVWVRIRFK